MKTNLILLFAICCSSILQAQTYGIVELQNQRFGAVHAFMSDKVTAEISFNWYNSILISPYVKAWTGTVNGQGFHSWTTKESIGMRITGAHDKGGFFLAGIAFSQFFAREVDPDNLLGKLKPLSCEFGFSARLDKGIWLIMITDPINWESCIGVGWDFTTRQQIYDRNYKLK